MHPVDPPLPDYVSGLEEAEQAPVSSDYMLGPEYPGYLALSDQEVPVEDQPYVAADSPIALSPGYITDSNPKEGPKDEDDADDEDEEEASKEDKDEDEEIEPFKTDESAATPPPPPAYYTTARMSIRAQTPIPFPSKEVVDRLLAIPTPPPSLLIPLSSPLPQIHSPPFPVPSPPTTSPTYTKAPLGYKAAEF
ncbi:hypothetical protein Tco_0699034 [Tanacetum coccineum]